MKLKFSAWYLMLAVLLFFTEVYIGAYMHDAVIRPYGGDFLVVIFIYCLLKSFLNIRVIPATIGVLLFAYMVEVSQYFHLIEVIGLTNSKAARLIMGVFFAWTDMLAYTLGMALVIISEYLAGNLKVNNQLLTAGRMPHNVVE